MNSYNNNDEMRDPSDPSQDLDWLAFCYIADELDADAKAEFEKRLESDVAACEAVASAVQLSSLVDGACKNPEPVVLSSAGNETYQSDGFRFAPSLVFAASILLCLFAAGWVWTNGSTGNNDSFEIASTWAESLTDEGFDLLQDDGSNEMLIVETSIALNSLDALNASDDLGSDGDWMLVALAEMEVDE